MPFACPNPSCRSVYNVSPSQAGTRFTCQNCGKPLIIEVDGLKFDTGSDAPAEAPKPVPPPSERFAWLARLPKAGGIQRLAEMIAADPHTWLFGAGALLVILFLFFPLL